MTASSSAGALVDRPSSSAQADIVSTLMRVAVAISLLVVVVLVALFSSGRSGGDTAELVGRLRGELEAKGMPAPLTDCMVRRLEASLDDKEIETLYDSERGARGGTAAVLATPKVEKAVIKAGIVCTQQLEKSGQFDREELMDALRELGAS